MEKLSQEMTVRDSIKQSIKLVLNYHHLLELNLKIYNNQFSFNKAKYLAFEKTVTNQINELKEHKKGLSL
jgi:hypothetical protein